MIAGIKIIFFDIDGTLLDYSHAEQMGARALLAEHRSLFSIDEEEFVRLWRELSLKHFLRYVVGEVSDAEQYRARLHELFTRSRQTLTDGEADTKFARYLYHYETNWRAYDDVLPCLAMLQGIPLGIISNGGAEEQRRKLKGMGVLNRFSPIVISGDIQIAKPNAKIFQEACRQAGLAPQQCLYIGDHLAADALGSQAVGMQGVWLNRLDEHKADEVPTVHNLTEFAAAVKR